MKIKFEWLKIYESNTGASSTWVAKVIGGWLFRHNYLDEDGNAVSMQFIPDPEHKWEI